MRMSQLFSQTLRERSAEAEVENHQLLLRAGFIRQLASGVFSYLPLARRSMNKIYRFCSGLEGVKTGIFLRGEATALPTLGLNASGQARRSLWEGPALFLKRPRPPRWAASPV